MATYVCSLEFMWGSKSMRIIHSVGLGHVAFVSRLTLWLVYGRVWIPETWVPKHLSTWGKLACE